MSCRLIEPRRVAGARGRWLASHLAVLSGLAACLLACGGEPRHAEAPLISVAEERAKAERPRGPRQLERAEVTRAIEGGLGKFLQHVFLEPSIVSGKFQGFRIVELRPAASWEGIELRAGDVVTQINGQSIERPEQAHAVFVGLKDADRVVVSYLRDGKPGEVVVPIVGGELTASDAATGSAPRDL